MSYGEATVLKLTPRESFDLKINEENLKFALHYLGKTEEEMLESFYEDNVRDKLIIRDKEKFRKEYTKAYIKIYTECAGRYCG